MTLKQNFAEQLKAQSDIWRAQAKDYQEYMEQAGEQARVEYKKAMATPRSRTALGNAAAAPCLPRRHEKAAVLNSMGVELPYTKSKPLAIDEAFYELDSPPVRITTPHIPLPAADVLQDLRCQAPTASPNGCGSRRNHRRLLER
jgi:hypothetical protein